MNNLVQNILSKACKYILGVHRIVRIIEPWSLLLVAMGFAITTAAFITTLTQLSIDNHVREAMLMGLASDRLEAARELDEKADDIARYDAGQVHMLEIISKLGISLGNVNLSYVNLRGIKLPGADLNNADLECTKLHRANLAGANLSEAELESALLSRTDLRDTNFTGANLNWADLNWIKNISEETVFSGASFYGTRLRNLDMSQAQGLEDAQLYNACGYDVKLPSYIKVKLRKCSKEQLREQKCERRKTELERTQGILRDIRNVLEDISKIESKRLEQGK